jgi:hypothetical protein
MNEENHFAESVVLALSFVREYYFIVQYINTL